MGYEYGLGWGAPMFMHGIGQFLFFLVFVVFAIWLFRAIFRRGHPAGACGDRENDAVSLLGTKYVNGDIDREEYLNKRADLLGVKRKNEK